MSEVVVVVGPGLIGQAIARRVGVGKHVLLADMRKENADAAAETLGNAGYDVSTATVDASSREAVESLVKQATSLGDVTRLVYAAGVSPSQAPKETVLKVDLYGTGSTPSAPASSSPRWPRTNSPDPAARATAA